MLGFKECIKSKQTKVALEPGSSVPCVGSHPNTQSPDLLGGPK